MSDLLHHQQNTLASQRIKALWEKLGLAVVHFNDGTAQYPNQIYPCAPYSIILKPRIDLSFLGLEIHHANILKENGSFAQEPLLNTLPSLAFLDAIRRFKKNWDEQGYQIEDGLRLRVALSTIFSILIPEDMP